MQGVVIPREPQQRMVRMTGKQFGNDAEAIDIWNDAGDHNSGFFVPMERSDAGKKPSGEEMSDWTHERRTQKGPPVASFSLAIKEVEFGANIW